MTTVTSALSRHLQRWAVVAYRWPTMSDPTHTVWLRDTSVPASPGVRGEGATLPQAMNAAARRIDLRV